MISVSHMFAIQIYIIHPGLQQFVVPEDGAISPADFPSFLERSLTDGSRSWSSVETASAIPSMHCTPKK